MSSELNTIQQILRKLSGKVRVADIYDEHNYATFWSSNTANQKIIPAKMLFMNAILQSEIASTHSDEETDVRDSLLNSPSPLGFQRNRVPSSEMERSLKCHLKDDIDGSELRNFPIQNYSSSKQTMFRAVMEVVNSNSFARISNSGPFTEILKRRLMAGRCGRQLRILFANYFCDVENTAFWVHKLIMDKGDFKTIASYLSFLQVLRLKSTFIVDEVIRSYNGRLKHDYVSQLIEKQSNPSTTVLNQYKLHAVRDQARATENQVADPKFCSVQGNMKKLPGTPLIIMCLMSNLSERLDRLMTSLSAMCRTMLMPMMPDDAKSMENNIFDYISSVRNKVLEFKNQFPNQPIIVSGLCVAALIASYVALEVPVDAVLCFGCPITSVNGSSIDTDDPLLRGKAPTLFIVGQNSNMCPTADIEVFRAHMNAVTGLVSVGGADDFLEVSPNKIVTEGISQEKVDRCILDEVCEFLENIFKSKQTKDSSNPCFSCSCAKVSNPKTILKFKSCSSPSCAKSSNSGSGKTKRVRFKLDEIARKVGQPPGSNNKKRSRVTHASKISKKASRMKSPTPLSVLSSVASSWMKSSTSGVSSQKFSIVENKTVVSSSVKLNAPGENKKVLKPPSTGPEVECCVEDFEKPPALHGNEGLEIKKSSPIFLSKPGSSVISSPAVPSTSSAANLSQPIHPFTLQDVQSTMPNKGQ